MSKPAERTVVGSVDGFHAPNILFGWARSRLPEKTDPIRIRIYDLGSRWLGRRVDSSQLRQWLAADGFRACIYAPGGGGGSATLKIGRAHV